MSFAETLALELRDAKLDVPPYVQNQLAVYANEMEHWNKAVNLTALRNVALVRRLIVDPVWTGQYLQMSGVLADVGSGNGSPGIPQAITRNFSEVHLIEPRTRRAAFLRHIAAKLALNGVSVDRSRIEELPAPAFRADWISLQAIDPKPVVVKALHSIASRTTRVVWITSVNSPPVALAEKICIPNSATVIWLFRLDQT